MGLPRRHVCPPRWELRILRSGMDQIGKMLVIAGAGIALLGAVLWLGSGLPWLRLGRLPGDITYQKDGFSFYFPITSMIALSVLFTLVLWIASAFRR